MNHLPTGPGSIAQLSRLNSRKGRRPRTTQMFSRRLLHGNENKIQLYECVYFLGCFALMVLKERLYAFAIPKPCLSFLVAPCPSHNPTQGESTPESWSVPPPTHRNPCKSGRHRHLPPSNQPFRALRTIRGRIPLAE